jgi:hypothetical protein
MRNASPVGRGANEIQFRRQVALPVLYWNKWIDVGYRMDVVVGGLVVVSRTGRREERDGRKDLAGSPAPGCHLLDSFPATDLDCRSISMSS